MRCRSLAIILGLIADFALVVPTILADEAAQVDHDTSPVLIGLDADMTAVSAAGGEAIRRGIVLALDEINRAGGLLGRPVDLVVRDHRGNPDRGIDNMVEFAGMDGLVAVVGGSHTPVAMGELDVIHEHGIIYLGPWAAGTRIVDNGREPNFVFRVSVRDEYAGEFLIKATFERGYRKPGLLLWQTAWGRSNEEAMRAALSKRGTGPAGVQWYNTSAKDVSKQIEALKAAGADVVLLVAEPSGGLAAVTAIAAMPSGDRLPIIAHWGMTAAPFFEAMDDRASKVDLTFLQTYSFFDPPFPERAKRLLDAYCRAFKACAGAADVFSPIGTAHAYDLVHLPAKAVRKVGSIDRDLVREAMERPGRHDGLVRRYDPPFTPDHHDALDERDFRLAAYGENGAIVPLAMR